MRYSIQAGGKRLRPTLLVVGMEALSAAGKADPFCGGCGRRMCAHLSLVHDDLPCMDDDDLRRGRPTAHRAFDEATALLAGDALLTRAFALLSESYRERPALAVALVAELSDASGSRRLVGGQMEDLLAERTGISDRRVCATSTLTRRRP